MHVHLLCFLMVMPVTATGSVEYSSCTPTDGQCIELHWDNDSEEFDGEMDRYFGLYLCSKNSSRYSENLCTSSASSIENWFEGIDFQTTMYFIDYSCNETVDTCEMKLSKCNQFGENQTSNCNMSKNTTVCCRKRPGHDLKYFLNPNLREHACEIEKKKREKEETEKETENRLKRISAVMCVIGLIAVVGNIVVIIHSVSKLHHKRFRLAKAKKLHKTMVLNLSVADLLMGIYMIAVASKVLLVYEQTDRRKASLRWRTSPSCTGLGIINFISSQISVTALVIITAVRTFSVLCPYKNIKTKLVVGIVLATWIFWVITACIPILHFESINWIFSYAVTSDKFFFRSDELRHIIEDSFLKGINTNCRLNADVTYKLPEDCYWKCLLSLATKFDLISSFEENHISYLGYYNTQKICSMQFLRHVAKRSIFFTIIILSYNIVSFVFILVCQVVICSKISSWPDILKLLRTCSRGSTRKRKQSNALRRRDLENQKMHWRMFFIVMTDFVCWIPISIISLRYLTAPESPNSKSFSRSLVKLQFLVIILISVNSAVNPFLYSARFWKSFVSKCRGGLRLGGLFSRPRDDASERPRTEHTSSSHVVISQPIQSGNFKHKEIISTAL